MPFYARGGGAKRKKGAAPCCGMCVTPYTTGESRKRTVPTPAAQAARTRRLLSALLLVARFNNIRSACDTAYSRFFGGVVDPQ